MGLAVDERGGAVERTTELAVEAGAVEGGLVDGAAPVDCDLPTENGVAIGAGELERNLAPAAGVAAAGGAVEYGLAKDDVVVGEIFAGRGVVIDGGLPAEGLADGMPEWALAAGAGVVGWTLAPAAGAMAEWNLPLAAPVAGGELEGIGSCLGLAGG